MIIRFDMYSRFPTRLWRLCRKYTSTQYGSDIIIFLSTDDKFLDGGYSLLLKKEALASGCEADAVAHLMSADVQAELHLIFDAVSASSLDVERKHAQDKRFETTKVTGCARASRNSILSRYLSGRQSLLQMRTLTSADGVVWNAVFGATFWLPTTMAAFRQRQHHSGAAFQSTHLLCRPLGKSSARSANQYGH